MITANSMQYYVKPIVKIFLFFLLLTSTALLFAIVLLLLAGIPLESLMVPATLPKPIQVIYVVGLYGFIVLDIFLFQSWRGQTFHDLGFGSRPVFFWLIGFALGTLMLVLQYLIQFFMGWMDWQGIEGGSMGILLLYNLPMAFAFALIEEILFRGWILHVLLEKWNLFWAILFQAYLYAQLHFLPLNKTGLISMLTLFLAGVFLAQLRLKYGSLWLPIGLHTAWIYWAVIVNQLHCFSFDPSAVFLTGGNQPETGWMSVLLLISSCLLQKKSIHFSG